MPDPNRNSSAVLIEGVNGALLIDAGEGVSSRLRQQGIWKQEISTIVLTHSHTDHVSGLMMLIQGWYLEERQSPLQIFAPAFLLSGLSLWLDTVRLQPAKLPFRIDFQELSGGKFNILSGHQLEAWENGHIASSEGGSYSLAVTDGGSRWVFSSDLVNLSSLASYLPGSTGLVVESYHIEPEEAVKMAGANGIKKVYLTHIPPECNCEPLAGAIWAEDNMLING